MFDGGAGRDRTDDLLNAIQALSQLSYGPMGWPAGLASAEVGMVIRLPPAGASEKCYFRAVPARNHSGFVFFLAGVDDLGDILVF